MTKLSREMDALIEDIDNGKYQVPENKHGKELLKMDMEDMYHNVIKDKEEQASYVTDLEIEIQMLNALLSKLGVKTE